MTTRQNPARSLSTGNEEKELGGKCAERGMSQVLAMVGVASFAGFFKNPESAPFCHRPGHLRRSSRRLLPTARLLSSISERSQDANPCNYRHQEECPNTALSNRALPLSISFHPLAFGVVNLFITPAVSVRGSFQERGVPCEPTTSTTDHFFRTDEQATAGFPLRNQCQTRRSRRPWRQGTRGETGTRRPLPVRFQEAVQEVLPQKGAILTA